MLLEQNCTRAKASLISAQVATHDCCVAETDLYSACFVRGVADEVAVLESYVGAKPDAQASTQATMLTAHHTPINTPLRRATERSTDQASTGHEGAGPTSVLAAAAHMLAVLPRMVQLSRLALINRSESWARKCKPPPEMEAVLL